MLGVFEKGNAKYCGDVSAVEVLCALIVGAPLKGNDGPEEDRSSLFIFNIYYFLLKYLCLYIFSFNFFNPFHPLFLLRHYLLCCLST